MSPARSFIAGTGRLRTMQKLKICLMTTVHDAFSTRIFYKEARSLAKAGHEVVLIVTHDRNEIVDGVRIVGLRKRKNRFARMTLTVWECLRCALREKADAYHFHVPELIPSGAFLKLIGKNVIYDMHENFPKDLRDKLWLSKFIRVPLSFIVPFFEFLFIRTMPIIFAETSYQKDYPWFKNSIVLLNLPLVDLCSPTSWEKPERFTLGYIGGVEPCRGSITTIEVLSELKRRDLEIGYECIGPADDVDIIELEQMCEQRGLRFARFYGELPFSKGMEILRKCSVGLAVLHPLANFNESYPTKMFEYMALGIPVIVSNFSLYQEIIDETKCGLCVDPLKPKEIADAVQWLLEHPKEAEQMGRNGQRAVLEKYNWNNEAKKLLDFYNTFK